VSRSPDPSMYSELIERLHILKAMQDSKPKINTGKSRTSDEDHPNALLEKRKRMLLFVDMIIIS